MGIPKFRNRRHILLFCVVLLVVASAHAATKWQDPTPEELSMISQPQVPGAPAVLLYREEIVDDDNGTWSYYSRIKILTQAGRDRYSDISIEYPSQGSDDNFNITSVAGRTIHPDGTIIPFTGKPYDRLVEKSSSETTREKVLTLPDVQVGSIIEYRYTMHLANTVSFARTFIPTFYAQTNSFARAEHFQWHTNQSQIHLTSSLPGGVSAIKIKQGEEQTYTIDLANVLPVPDEPEMPPLSSLVQKVVFYTDLPDTIRNAQDFWDRYGTFWSRDIDEFIGPPSKLAPAAAEITAGVSTPEEKLRKLYAAVQQMENTNFSRERSARENKVIGVSDPKSVRDVLQQKRGDDLQLTLLFVGLARAAGMKAYIMAVANRDTSHFEPQQTTFSQLNDDVAVVELNNQEILLDPAEPLCPFGQLLWPHSNSGGLRQTSTGVALARSPLPGYKDSETRRVANLILDDTGHESGTVDMSFSGAPALRWRQNTLLGDEAGLHQDLEKYLLDLIPKGSDVTLTSVEYLHDADKPLVVHFKVSGPLANFTGKSSFVPAQFFEVNDTPLFPADTRTLPIEFSYPETIHDAVWMKFPASWQVDTAPLAETDVVPKTIGCDYRVQLSPTSIILRRDFVLGTINVDPSRYTDLRNFYEKVVTRDHASVLFRIHPNPTPTP
jgi:hypothetical protein